MSGIGTGYDLSATTYSPDGRLFQVEYAQKAVDNAPTVIGIRCKDGVVLGVEKPVVSKMLVEGSNRRVFAVDRHAGMVSGGLAPDGRMLVNRAMEEASNYKSFYGDAIPANILSERLASYVHLFTLYWSVRPFGASTLLAASDSDGPALYLIEPTGSAHRFRGMALGKNRQAAKNEIERLDLGSMTVRDGIKAVVRIIHQLHDEGKPFEVELGWVGEETKGEFRKVPAEVLAEAETAAKAAMADSDMDSD